MYNQIARGVLAGALVIGGIGAALIVPGLVEAADPSASPSATTPAPTTGTDGSSGTTAPDGCPGGRGMHGGPGGLDADDLTAAATALGMTEADLTTALESGKTAADVAADQGVDVQQVIDAIVASDKAEIDAAVKAGTMTQAQADQRLANLTQHVTDEVNGVAGGPGGRGMHGGPGDQAPAASPSTSGSTSS